MLMRELKLNLVTYNNLPVLIKINKSNRENTSNSSSL
jgi:hypothetical protein